MTTFAPLPTAPTFAPIVGRWAELCRARERTDIVEWCEKSIILPESVTSDPGPLRFSRTPYMREPLRLFADPKVERISLVWGTQLGKTLLDQLMLAWMVCICPAPALFAGPNQAVIRKLRDKFRLICEASPALRRIAPPSRGWNDISINFRDSLCYLGYAGSTQTLSGESCKYVWKFELDRWRDWEKQGSSAAKADERPKNWLRFKIVNESTATDETSAIYAEYYASNKCSYQLGCHRCGHYQELRFFKNESGDFKGRGQIMGLKDERGNWLSTDEVIHAAWYECEACGGRIDNWQKPKMLERAWWVPEGAYVNSSGELDGTPLRSPRHSGLRLSTLNSPKKTFGQVAEKYLITRDDPQEYQVFWNDWLALQWAKRRKQPPWEVYARRLAGNHRRGFVPPQAYFLTCAVDVQADHLRWGVRAWGEGCTSWLVDFGVIYQGTTLNADNESVAIPNSDLDTFYREIWPRSFQLVAPNSAGRSQLPIYRAGIDSQHRTWDVYEWWHSHRSEFGDRLLVVAGDAKVPAGEFYRMNVVEKNSRTNKPYPGAIERWGIQVDLYKADIRKRWDADLNEPGAWWVYQGIRKDENGGEDYMRQICSESPQKFINKRTEKESTVWLVGDKKVGNHYFDIEVYNRMLADKAVEVEGRPDWTNLERRAVVTPRVAQPQKQPFTTPDGRAFLATER